MGHKSRGEGRKHAFELFLSADTVGIESFVCSDNNFTMFIW